MARYQDKTEVTHETNARFDTIHKPGVQAPSAGIYMCVGCSHEVGIARGHRLPPEDHHTHTSDQGSIRWRLLVLAQHVDNLSANKS